MVALNFTLYVLTTSFQYNAIQLLGHTHTILTINRICMSVPALHEDDYDKPRIENDTIVPSSNVTAKFYPGELRRTGDVLAVNSTNGTDVPFINATHLLKERKFNNFLKIIYFQKHQKLQIQIQCFRSCQKLILPVKFFSRFIKTQLKV